MNTEDILYAQFQNRQLTLSEYLKRLNTNNIEELRKLVDKYAK